MTILKDTRFVPLHILVVDNNDIERKASVEIIRDNQHIATEASTGEAALVAAYDIPFDLILLELHLPNMNGFEVAKLIRTLPATRGWVPIIALTQTDNHEDVRKCFQVGMSNFILKPLTTSSLLAATCTYSARKNVPAIQFSYFDGSNQ